MEGYVKEDEATGQDMPADFEDGNTAEPRGPSDLPQGRVDGVLRGQEHQRGPEGEGKGEDDAGGGQPSGTMPTQRYGNTHGRYAAPRGAERGGSGSNAKTVQPDGCWRFGAASSHMISQYPEPIQSQGQLPLPLAKATAKSWARQLPSTDKMHRQ